MKKFTTILFLLVCFTGPAEAHRDRILHVGADGSIQGLPAAFGPARLLVEGLGSKHPLIQLRIGANQTTLPLCVVRMIRTRSIAEIQVSGSWYHDEKGSLPYYLDIRFHDASYDPNRGYNTSQKFLFNLHNAKLIDATFFKADPSGRGGQGSALKLPPGCKLEQNG